MLRRQWIDVAMALLLLGIVLWLARSLLFTGVYPWGTDILGHLYKVWYLGDHWQHYGGLAQWTPHWYNGTPITQYDPPLVYYLMLPLQLVLDNIAVVYRVSVTAFVLGAAYLTYFLFKGRLGRPAAAGHPMARCSMGQRLPAIRLADLQAALRGRGGTDPQVPSVRKARSLGARRGRVPQAPPVGFVAASGLVRTPARAAHRKDDAPRGLTR